MIVIIVTIIEEKIRITTVATENDRAIVLMTEIDKTVLDVMAAGEVKMIVVAMPPLETKAILCSNSLPWVPWVEECHRHSNSSRP